MDSPKQAPLRGSPRRSPKATRPGGAMEADENAGPTRPVPAGDASPLRRKVLGERNSVGGGMEAATPPAQPKPVPSPPSLTGCAAGPYDPKVNYTTPRPKFLRYDPERHREMLLRLAREAEVEDDCSSTASGVTASVASASSVSSAPSSDSEAKLDNSDEEEEEEFIPARRGRWARRLFLLLLAIACSSCYIYCMNPTPLPVHSENALDFTGVFGGMYHGAHELDSVRLLRLGPLYMMGPEDVLEETASQIVQGGGEGAVHQYNQRASSRNIMAISMMGLADMCPSVQLGELACIIGFENSESVDDLKESSELSEQNAVVMMGSFENATPCSSGLVHQEVGEDYSNQFEPQLVSVEKAVGSASDALDSGIGLESEGLNLDIELCQYENTAAAAREICSKLKFVWSAMEPHLLQILACLSVAGFVATLFKYYPRSREITVPVSQEMPSKSLEQVPVLVPQNVQLPVSSSPLVMQLPMGSSEQHVQHPVPKQDRFEVPIQLPLPKSGPSVSFNVPVVDHGNHDQKGQAETLKASHGNPRDHRDDDSSKPPVVELLGEFTFADSSRVSNYSAGDVSVQESLESLGEVVEKMPKNSSILQSPSVRRARKEENPEKREKDVTPTLLRRSSRLRNKVTSP